MVRLVLGLILVLEIVGLAWYATQAEEKVTVPPLPPGLLDPISAAEVTAQYERALGGDAGQIAELSRLYTLNGLFSEAELCGRMAVARSPESYDGRIWWAIALDRLGMIDEAREAFSEAHRFAPEDERARCLYYVARCHLKLEQPDQAEQVFRESQAYAPSRFELAKLLVRSDRLEEGMDLVMKLSDEFPIDSSVLQLRSRAQIAAGDLDAAVDGFELAERGGEQIPLDGLTEFLIGEQRALAFATHIATAEKLVADGQLEAAVSELKDALAARWEPNVAVRAITTMAALGRFEEAEVLLDQLAGRECSSGQLFELRGMIQVASRRADEAAASLRHSTQLSDAAGTHMLLAKLLKEQGENEDATHHEAVAIEQTGFDRLHENDLEGAKQLLTKATEQRPDSARAWFLLGETHRFLGEDAEAKVAYTKALELDPNHGRAELGRKRLRTAQE